MTHRGPSVHLQPAAKACELWPWRGKHSRRAGGDARWRRAPGGQEVLEQGRLELRGGIRDQIRAQGVSRIPLRN